MKTLAERINEVAARMGGCFREIEGIKIPHSQFVKWDDIQGIIEDPCFYDEDEEPYTEDATDEQIEAFIRKREDEGYIDEYYNDQICEYVENHLKEEA